MAAVVCVDLVLDTGELVRIDCPRRHEDALHDSLEHAMKRRDWWSPARLEGCNAEYLGMPLDRINMGRVVGTL